MSLNLEREISHLLEAKIRDFLEWAAKNWTVTSAEAIRDNIFDSQPEGYREGYNAAIENLPGALECWLEEQT